jgi:hypothetical protein
VRNLLTAKDLVNTLWWKSEKQLDNFQNLLLVPHYPPAVCNVLKRKGLQTGHLQVHRNERDAKSRKEQRREQEEGFLA